VIGLGFSPSPKTEMTNYFQYLDNFPGKFGMMVFGLGPKVQIPQGTNLFRLIFITGSTSSSSELLLFKD